MDIDIYIKPEQVSGKYEIGRGGFGVIYKAKMDGRDIVIKELLNSSLETANKWYFFQRVNTKNIILIEEAKKLTKLWNRGGITNFLGLINNKDRISIAMEYVSGGTLLDYITEQGQYIGWEGKRILLEKIANALSMCHDVGIIHSDIKAENILMDHDLNPKIADFGASIFINNNNTTEYAGSLKWTSPERLPKRICDKLGPPTFKSDVYSFGILCYEVLTEGNTPYDEIPEESLWFVITKREIPFNNLPLEFIQIMRKCVIKNTKERINMDKVLTLFNFDKSREQIKMIVDAISDEANIIEKIRSMSILMVKEQNIIAQQLLSIMETLSGNINNAKKYAQNKELCMGSTLSEVIRVNDFKDLIPYLYPKCKNISIDDMKYMILHGVNIDDELLSKTPGYELFIIDIALKKNIKFSGKKCCEIKFMLTEEYNLELDYEYKKTIDISCFKFNNILTTVNLSRCTNIVDIGCFEYNNSITTLDLSFCKNLNNISCFSKNNSITHLDMSGCDKIIDIGCFEYNDKITTLDLSYCYGIVDVGCFKANRNISNLNLSCCKNIVDIECFKYNNSITILDLSYCVNIVSINCFKYNNIITSLNLKYCKKIVDIGCFEYNNSIAILDLSYCKNIVNISCFEFNNSITTLKLINCEKIIDITPFSKNKCIKTLYLSYCINILDITCFGINNTITKLDLSGCKKIVNINCFGTNNSIKHLMLSDCSNIVNISCFSVNNSIAILDLSDCSNIDDINCFKYNNSIRSLDISSCKKIVDVSCFVSNNINIEIYLLECNNIKNITLLDKNDKIKYYI